MADKPCEMMIAPSAQHIVVLVIQRFLHTGCLFAFRANVIENEGLHVNPCIPVLDAIAHANPQCIYVSDLEKLQIVVVNL